ncbi:MAG: MAPEG family protein [Gammaproteobacteria bacterium]
MFEMKFTALATFAALACTFVLSAKVGRMRGKHEIKAPATTGHPEFERAFRVHGNTVEQLVLLLPLMWMATAVVGDAWSAAAGAVWVAGRIVYARDYMRDPTVRGTGMVVTALPTFALFIVVLAGILNSF